MPSEPIDVLGRLAVGAVPDNIGVVIGRPVAEHFSRENAIRAIDTTDSSVSRLWVDCHNLDPDQNCIEYPPGDKIAALLGRGIEEAPANAFVWVLSVTLGRLTLFEGSVTEVDTWTLKVEYGSFQNPDCSVVLEAFSQQVQVEAVHSHAGSWLCFDSIIAFPWRSDTAPCLSMRLMRPSRCFGRKLPFCLGSSCVAKQSITLPFVLQQPRRITQEILLESGSGSPIGSIQVAADFKQVQVALLREGGLELAFEMLESSADAFEAPAMGALPPAGTAAVLGQPIAGPFHGVTTGARQEQRERLEGDVHVLETTTHYPDGVTHTVRWDGPRRRSNRQIGADMA